MLPNRDADDVDVLEAMKEEGPEVKPFRIFCFKEPKYLMKIMASWMTLEELEGADKIFNYKGRDGQYLVNLFKYWHPIGFNFWH